MNRPLIPPAYRNEHLRDFREWYRANEPAISEYFAKLVAIDPQGCDFIEFAVLQHEREEFRARQAAVNNAMAAV